MAQERSLNKLLISKNRMDRKTSPNHFKTLILPLWISSIFGFGLLMFTGGFLLTRVEVAKHSSEFQPRRQMSPPGGEQQQRNVSAANSTEHFSTNYFHWQTYQRAIIIIIDGWRYDFVHQTKETRNFYSNKMKFLQSMIKDSKENAKLFKFIADPPTTTMQRLKGLTTGKFWMFPDVPASLESIQIGKFAESMWGGDLFHPNCLCCWISLNNNRALFSFVVA